MRLQSMILPNRICEETLVYCRYEGQVRLDRTAVVMGENSVFSTDTYMNMFDVKHWLKYTDVVQVNLICRYIGKGNLEIHCVRDGQDLIVEQLLLDSTELAEVNYTINAKDNAGIIYCRIICEEQLTIYSLNYECNEAARDIKLGINICTYKREKKLKSNLDTFYGSSFFDEKDELYGKMIICVVDNASEIQLDKHFYVNLIHNENTGGSGGFTAGIRYLKNQNLTHVVMMDDDVEFYIESFYRLYALLAYMGEDCGDCMIAGRMFRTDDRYLQYTASEVWNGGDLRHIGYNSDMRERKTALAANEGQGEYSGWWLACFGIDFIKANEPEPFFLHCDDVEYGLRHGGMPIILNGFQVWHETAEYRQSPVITYYDWRNSLFVNEKMGIKEPKEELMKRFMWTISDFYSRGELLQEYMVIRAVRDYLRGFDWLHKLDSARYHKKLTKIATGKYKNAIFSRLVIYLINKKYF